MNKKDLDAWITEHAFGGPEAIVGPAIIGCVPLYSQDAQAFAHVKHEILRRGWSWMAMGGGWRNGKGRYTFAIWDHVRDGGQHAVYAPELGRYTACTEELAGCEAFKIALMKSNGL